MDPSKMNPRELFLATAIATLAAFGIKHEPGNTYRFMSKYDTQDIPAAAGTTIDFFDQSTSSRSAHARGEYGCNLREPGKIDEKETFVVLGYGFQIVEQSGGTAAKANDVALVRDFGYLKELEIDDRAVDRFRELASMGMNRGVTLELIGSAGTLDYDMVTTGQPGIRQGLVDGHELQAFERQILTPGTAIKATIGHNAAANLSAALSARFHLHGISIKPQG